MTEQDAALQVARDARQAAVELLAAHHHAAAAFYACHAFEMAGSAFILSVGEQVASDHAARCRQFAAVAGRYGIGHGVSAVAFQAAALRNKSLYPVRRPGGTYLSPRQYVRPDAARRLVSRVGGIVRVVSRNMPQAPGT